MKAEHVKEEITKNEYLGCKKRYFLVMKREPFYKSRLFSYYFSFPNNSESGVQRPCLPFQNLPDPWRFCRNRAHHSGWADMVPPSRYRVPEVTGASHLMWSNKHQLWERGGSRICRVKGRALCFLRREDTWVCLIAGENVPFEKQTGAHKRNNWLEQDFWGGGRVPRVQKRFGFRWSRKCVSKALGRRRHLQLAQPEAWWSREEIPNSSRSRLKSQVPTSKLVHLGSLSSSKKIRILYFHPSFCYLKDCMK